MSAPDLPPFALVVTADDFGIGRATSAGIVRAHLHGPVTATSLMTVTGDHARASVPLLADAPDLDVGLHLVFTRAGERPLIARQSSGLVDHGGDFLTNGQLWIKAFAGKLDRAGVADEIAAQTEMFHKLMGRAPAYVDGHHHAHQLPTIREALADVMGHGLLPPVTRITPEPAGIAWGVSSVATKRAAARLLGRRAAAAFSKRWVWSNDYFFGMLSRGDLARPFPWAKYLSHLPTAGVVEWVVHPGEPDETLAGRDDYDSARAVELTALTSEENKRFWEPLGPALSRKSVLCKTPVDAVPVER